MQAADAVLLIHPAGSAATYSLAQILVQPKKEMARTAATGLSARQNAQKRRLTEGIRGCINKKTAGIFLSLAKTIEMGAKSGDILPEIGHKMIETALEGAADFDKQRNALINEIETSANVLDIDYDGKIGALKAAGNAVHEQFVTLENQAFVMWSAGIDVN